MINWCCLTWINPKEVLAIATIVCVAVDLAGEVSYPRMFIAITEEDDRVQVAVVIYY